MALEKEETIEDFGTTLRTNLSAIRISSVHIDKRCHGSSLRKNLSKIFPVSKKVILKERMVLDLFYLNRYIVRPSFKMTTVNSVKQVIQKNEWMVSINLEDAY